MKINEQIDKALAQGKKALVFTQSPDVVRSFLYDHPGKWTACVNHKFWPREVSIHDKPGKITMVPEGTAMVGVDTFGSDVIFTCRPTSYVPTNYIIIQGSFKSPIVRLREREALDNINKPDIVFTDNADHYRIRRILTNKPDVTVGENVRYAVGEHGIIRIRLRRIVTDDLACLHAISNVWVDQEAVWDDVPSFNQCNAVLDAIGILGDASTTSCVNAEWVSKHVVCNPIIVPKALEFMAEAGVLKGFNRDESTVTIARRGEQAQAFTYTDARKRFGDDFMREFKALEEAKQLTFGYHCSIKRYYVAIKTMSRADYNIAVRLAREESGKWYQSVENAKWMNTRLHENVRKMYRSHEVYMLDDNGECHLVGETGRVSI